MEVQEVVGSDDEQMSRGLFGPGFDAASLAGTAASATPVTTVAAPGTPDASLLVDPEEAVKALYRNTCDLMRQFGGPSQYLSQTLKDPTSGADFVKWLWATFPECDDVLYSYGQKLPTIESEQEMGEQLPIRVHVATLSFDPSSSLKPPCGADLGRELTALFLKDGFITGSGPLILSQPEHQDCSPYPLTGPWDKGTVETALRPFSVGYLKGFARSSSLLMILHRCMVLRIDIKGMIPQLHETVSKISCFCMVSKSRVDDALFNMKMSAKGSLRKAVNLVQCVYILKNLMKCGGLHDASVFIKRWNSMTSKTFQIAGRKSMALKQLFDVAPKDVLDSILVHVGALSWEKCVWSDDNLSSKKIFPGFQFSGKGQWASRLRTTDESMALMVDHLQNKHLTRNAFNKKPDISEVEACAQMAAACHHLAVELLQQVPVPSDKIKEQWLENFRMGEGNVESELETILLDKATNFNIQQDVPTLRRLVEELNFTRPVAVTPEAEASLVLDKWNLVKKQLEYDVAVFETWSRKCSSLKAAAEQAKHEWRLQRRKRCLHAAHMFLQNCVHLRTWSTKRPELSIAEIMNLKRLITSKSSCPGEDICFLIFFNATVPSLIPKDIYKQQVSVLTWALNDSMASMALVLLPTFVYSKGKLPLEEKQLMERLLGNGNHNVDWSFHVLFGNRVDPRDMRPMVYSGKMIFASPLELTKNPWFSSDLRRNQRTAEVKQISSKDMREIESLNDDTPPMSIDDRDRVSAANRYFQVGSNACSAILDAALTGTVPEPKQIILLDLFVRTGDCLESFTKLRQGRSNVHYMGFCENQDEMAFLESFLKDNLAESYETGTPTCTGEKIEQTMNVDLAEAQPAHPRLNIMVIKDEALHLPVAVVREWQNHSQVGPDFQAFLDKFVEMGYKLIDPEEESKKKREEEDRKRGAGEGGGGPQPSPKRARVAEALDSSFIIPGAEISSPLIQEIKLGANWPTVHCRGENTFYLVNGTEKPFSQVDACIAFFGSGSYKIIKDNQDMPPKAVIYSLESSKDMVVLNGVRSSLSDVVSSQRQRKPDCKLCYFDMMPAGDDVSQFTCKRKQKVVFIPKAETTEEGATVAKHNGAGLLPWGEKSTCLKLIWHVRWCQKGLSPVKPALHILGNLELPGGHAVKLHK